MKDTNDKNTSCQLGKSKQKGEDEYIDVFKYFANANMRNRDAFCELLDYTFESEGDIHQ